MENQPHKPFQNLPSSDQRMFNFETLGIKDGTYDVAFMSSLQIQLLSYYSFWQFGSIGWLCLKLRYLCICICVISTEGALTRRMINDDHPFRPSKPLNELNRHQMARRPPMNLNRKTEIRKDTKEDSEVLQASSVELL